MNIFDLLNQPPGLQFDLDAEDYFRPAGVSGVQTFPAPEPMGLPQMTPVAPQMAPEPFDIAAMGMGPQQSPAVSQGPVQPVAGIMPGQLPIQQPNPLELAKTAMGPRPEIDWWAMPAEKKAQATSQAAWDAKQQNLQNIAIMAQAGFDPNMLVAQMVGGDVAKEAAKAYYRDDRTSAEKDLEAAGYTPGTPRYQLAMAQKFQGIRSEEKFQQDLELAEAEALATGRVEMGLRADERAAKKAEDQKFDEIMGQGRLGAMHDGQMLIEDVAGRIEQMAGPFTTGWAGVRLADLEGTEAHQLRNELSTLHANAAFGRLQEMRDQSKTGGALGQVSERELALLRDAYGSMMNSMNADDLKYNMRRYLDLSHNSMVRAHEAYFQQFGRYAPSDPRALGKEAMQLRPIGQVNRSVGRIAPENLPAQQEFQPTPEQQALLNKYLD